MSLFFFSSRVRTYSMIQKRRTDAQLL
jgi:hypothetical protein